jgi:monovalent cation:H+ antiporter-2, CPA2 family
MDLFVAAAAAPPFLAEIAALIVAGAGIAYVCYRLGLVPILGFLIAGVVIGPHALGLVQDQELVDAAAEVGVILLLFTIGIEFSLERLSAIKRLIFGGGTMQVLLATGATTGLLAALGVDWKAALFTGFLVSLSSTAIVLKLLADRRETNTTPGQLSLGLLIFQDLAVIVMVLLIPMLSSTGGSASGILTALGTAALVIAVVLFGARRLMPRLLEVIARTCSPELFLLSVIAICFGTAYLTSLAGVSVSLGAFLAGLMVSESRFSQHAFGEIMPLQILFSATFFISVGMLLDIPFLAGNLLLVAGIVAAVLLIKAITTGLSVRALGYSLPVSAASALLLAQVGEFSFVLERAGRELGLTPAGMGEAGSQAFIAATVLLMICTPSLARAGMKLAGVRGAHHEPSEALAPDEAADQHAVALSDHAIVLGYGYAARRITPALAKAHVPLVIVTLSPGGAKEAEAAGYTVIRGDYSKNHILVLAGIYQARMAVIADDDPAHTHRVAQVVQALNPEVRLLVRTRAEVDAERLAAAGVDLAVSGEAAAARALTDALLQEFENGPTGSSGNGRGALSPAPATPKAGPVGAQPLSSTIEGEETPMLTTFDPERPVTWTPRLNTNECTHLDQIRTVYPSARGCEECLQTGDTWVHLRLCMICGHVGCCDSSTNKHARRHFHRSGHPIVRSLEPGESWGWCFEDDVML